MNRAFSSFTQKPYSSVDDFLHEVRSVCENACDLHGDEGDKVRRAAMDIHEFVEELMALQRRPENPEMAPETSQANMQISGVLVENGAEAPKQPDATGPLDLEKFPEINLLLLNELIHQRRLAIELTRELLKHCPAAITQLPQRQNYLVWNGRNQEETADWQEHSESDEEMVDDTSPNP
ncbi:unnamed protein product, partial [Mesorhabditis spiculigera]